MITFALFAIAAGCLTDLYSFAIGDPAKGEIKEGRILSFIGRYLEHRYYIAKDRAAAKFAQAIHASKDGTASEKILHEGVQVWKALGLCPRCTNVWISIPVFAIWWTSFSGDWKALLLLPVFLGLSSLGLSIAERLR